MSDGTDGMAKFTARTHSIVSGKKFSRQFVIQLTQEFFFVIDL